MGRIIAVTNHKGGTGKSTTAVNLSSALRKRGYDVLIIDADSQANATETFTFPDGDGQTLSDALRDRITMFVKPRRIYDTDAGCGVLDIVPSTMELAVISNALDQAHDTLRLRDVANKYRPWYDFIVIDTPPAPCAISLGAIAAADELIVPTTPQYLDVHGLTHLSRSVEAVNQHRQTPPVTRVLLTRYDSRRIMHRETAASIRETGVFVFDTVIRENVSLAESPYIHRDIFAYSPKSNGAKDYNALCDEYLSHTPVEHVRHNYR